MNRSYQLHSEVLESRRLLAGNVTAEVVNGDLFLRGDGDANDITIDQDTLTSPYQSRAANWARLAAR